MINFKIFTLFPEMFPGPLATSITGIALKNNLWSFEAINIRNFAKDERKTVDDEPYGGGAGMVLKAEIIADAIESSIAKIPENNFVNEAIESSKSQAVTQNKNSPRIIYLSPRGKPLTQKLARELALEKQIALLCGRYEGVDQRVIDELQIEEISIGDYVLSGGELAAYVIIDAVLRNVSGVLGKEESAAEESFSIDGSEFLLEYPHYTRPALWRNKEVPEILVSGHHKNIKSWRLQKAIELTKSRRNDLYQKFLQNQNK